jgi:hypothetical protein
MTNEKIAEIAKSFLIMKHGYHADVLEHTIATGEIPESAELAAGMFWTNGTVEVYKEDGSLKERITGEEMADVHDHALAMYAAKKARENVGPRYSRTIA